MAVKTSAANGLASVGATWVGGVPPVDGDTIIQNHNVDYDYDLIIGTSDVASVIALDAGVNDIIKFKDGVTIELRGTVRYAGQFAVKTNVLHFEAGTTVFFNSEFAAAPTTTRYDFRPAAGGTGASILIAGTLSKPVTIYSNANGARGRFNRNGLASIGHFEATYCHFIDMGDASNIYLFEMFYGSNGIGAGIVDFQNCLFTRTGGVNFANAAQTNGICRFKNCTFRETLGTNAVALPAFTGAGTKDITGSVFDKNVFIGDGAYAMGDEGQFHDGFSISGRTIATVQTGHMFFRRRTAVDTNNPGDLSDVYWLMHSGTGHAYSNPHFISFFMNRNYSATRVIGEYTGTGINGDFFATTNPANPRTHTITNCILLPNINNEVPGKFLSGGGANVTWDIRHNTWISSVDSVENGVSWGELAGAHLDMFNPVKSNLSWHPNSNKALIISRLTGTLQDGASAANVTHNAIWNGFTGSDGLGFHSFSVGNAFTGTPNSTGGVSLASNPFVDNTRRFHTWGQSLGITGANTEEIINNTLAEMMKKNDFSGFNSAFTVQALNEWVSQGYNVTAATLENAGHDGVTIGARPFATLNPKSKVRYRYNELIGGI